MRVMEKDIDLMLRAVANPLGVVEITGGGTGDGLRKHAFDKRMSRLVGEGYFKPYVHGGYEITEKGINAAAILDFERKRP